MTTAETHPGRFEQMTVVMVSVGTALRALALGDLPPIAGVQVVNDSMRGLRAELQLSAVAETASGLAAWADVLISPRIAARDCGRYVRMDVVGVLGGECVCVWGHVEGAEALRNARTAFGLSPATDYGVTLDALRAYAQEHEGGER